MNFNASIRVVSFLIITLSLSGCIETCDTAQDASIDRTADESAIHALLTANFAASTARNAANIHDDPRWLPFLESIGRSPEQLAAIEFNVTLPE